MGGCWAFNCSNRSEKGYKLYAFPNKAKKGELHQTWVRKVNRLDMESNPRYPKLLQPGSKSVLCEVILHLQLTIL